MSVQELDQTADELLMKRYGKGNASAFELLYKRHKGPLFRFILRQVSDRSTAEELFQDIWSRVIAQRTSYHVSAKFTTWLYTIARNRIIDYYRVNGKHQNRIADDSSLEEDIGEDHFVCDQRPELVLESEKSLARIRELVAALPASQREAFILKYDAGFNHHDIAAITGQKEETIKSQIRYAINKLKQGLFGGRDD
ncbi:MAG: sigma-70 family RNA polymerase sigma factor [Ketobacteraceae bacterium]|nr:sigma-70 family RNA polymerase sigma factor [Ketobacteraceae bacterium]